ncbi:hypothetical protein [Kiritimatiella glycovorans]|uniref:PAS fold protein n=1 Tax=Kiritimatiella glycovorans TaxID=1307763 RepID=A0A0G3EAA2_9BACT|nr:hypothetical protein [Kiritimatiella glycovorans]AKJ63371.1 hypothetical protein L21SP4_00084 [Kiritimatiella glycovorans]
MRACIYETDADGVLVSACGDWDRFAGSNDAPQCRSERMVGKPLMDFIRHEGTQAVYQALIERACQSEAPLEFPFRCDAPDLIREMWMRMEAGEHGGVRFTSSVISERSRKKISLLDASIPHAKDELVHVCGWCKKIRTPEGWAELEDGVRRMGLFHCACVPRVSHGMCEQCCDTIAARFGLSA